MKSAYENTQEYIKFQLQMIRNMKLRSEANLERLKNEITLVETPYQYIKQLTKTLYRPSI